MLVPVLPMLEGETLMSYTGRVGRFHTTRSDVPTIRDLNSTRFPPRPPARAAFFIDRAPDPSMEYIRPKKWKF
ncbi:hypothetical protein [Cereibacter sphaeroides]|uniref:hypothetical protein n=1 Tax=Cereibacter sphaeroides TaxID=1063 RepID=UPI000F526B71|nr:hypothetical protein [Cereibacter sphaeroides]